MIGCHRKMFRMTVIITDIVQSQLVFFRSKPMLCMCNEPVRTRAKYNNRHQSQVDLRKAAPLLTTDNLKGKKL